MQRKHRTNQQVVNVAEIGNGVINLTRNSPPRQQPVRSPSRGTPTTFTLVEVEDEHIRVKLDDVCLTLQVSGDAGEAGYVSAKSCRTGGIPKRVQLAVESVDHALTIAQRAHDKLRAFDKKRTGASGITASGSGRVVEGSTLYLPFARMTGYLFKLTWEPAGRRARSPRPPPQSNIDTLQEAASLAAATVGALRKILQNHTSAPYPLPNRLYYASGHHPAWRRINEVPENGSAPPTKFRPEPPPGTPITSPVAFRFRQATSLRPNRLNLNARLGEGTYGEVFRVKLTDRHREYAEGLSRRVPRSPHLPLGEVAAVKLQPVDHNERVYQAIAESKIHAQLVPTGAVPRLYASGYDAQHQTFVTIMQLINGTELEEWLQDRDNVLPAKLFVAIEDAVVKMWRAGIAHADLNSKNIMVLPNNKEVKIIDFSLSIALPKRLIPESRQQALDRSYQARLLEYLESKYRNVGFDRGAADPHVLRWLYSLVTNKAGVARLRRQ